MMFFHCILGSKGLMLLLPDLFLRYEASAEGLRVSRPVVCTLL